MANRNASSAKRARKSAAPTALGAGVHPATLELKDGNTYRTRLLSGQRVTATPAPGVSERLLDECLCARRLAMLADGEHGPIILGALQTDPTPHVDATSGAFEVQAEHIRLSAEATISLRVGTASIALEKSGVARIEGEQMVIDVAALVRVLTARVELP